MAQRHKKDGVVTWEAMVAISVAIPVAMVEI